MAITQTVEIPADRRITLEVPREVPTGQVILTFTLAPAVKPNAKARKNPRSETLSYSSFMPKGLTPKLRTFSHIRTGFAKGLNTTVLLIAMI